GPLQIEQTCTDFIVRSSNALPRWLPRLERIWTPNGRLTLRWELRSNGILLSSHQRLWCHSQPDGLLLFPASAPRSPPDEVSAEGKSDRHFEKLNNQFCSGHFCTISRHSE